jgi:hypothetical protein
MAGDLDGDGAQDLLYSSPAGAFFLRNLGAGAFAPPRQLSDRGVDALGDLNGDGLPDLVGFGDKTPGGLPLLRVRLSAP